MANIEKLKEIIYFHNPWWIGQSISHELLADYERPVLKRLLSYLNLERILVIKGPRRTGKTTLLYQMIDYLLKNGIEAKNILYLSFDDLQTRQDFDQIIKVYQELVKKVLPFEKEVYFFLDEVQFLENWSLYLKRYFDKKYPIKFIVSGSAASLIKKNSESLAGRTIEEIVFPFSFYEYLDYCFQDKKLKEIVHSLRGDFVLGEFPLKDDLIPYETQIKILWEEYLGKGGFPHLFKVKEKILWEKLLREDVIQKVIYRDLVELYQIKKPFVLERLFLYLIQNSSQLLNISNLANSLKLSREYSEKYVEYLKQAYLIFKIKRHSGAMESQIRKMEKCYVTDPGLMQLSGRIDLGKVVETTVAVHLKDRPLHYWREHYEVDFILDTKKGFIPIEVKYKDEIDTADLKGLLKFLDISAQRYALVITRDLLKEEKRSNKLIHYLPAWLFVMLV